MLRGNFCGSTPLAHVLESQTLTTNHRRETVHLVLGTQATREILFPEFNSIRYCLGRMEVERSSNCQGYCCYNKRGCYLSVAPFGQSYRAVFQKWVASWSLKKNRGKKSIHHHCGTPFFSVCRPTPRSQSKKRYGAYHFLGETREKGIHHRSGKKGIHHEASDPEKKKQGFHGGGVYFFLPGKKYNPKLRNKRRLKRYTPAKPAARSAIDRSHPALLYSKGGRDWDRELEWGYYRDST